MKIELRLEGRGKYCIHVRGALGAFCATGGNAYTTGYLYCKIAKLGWDPKIASLFLVVDFKLFLVSCA
jgi:hypothetical protein